MSTPGVPLRALLLACCLMVQGPVCAKGDPPANRVRVLFVGNSYLYTNDLPDAVAKVAASRGLELFPGMLADPDFAIEDHIRNGNYARMIALGWDWVILQQGPSSLPANQIHLRTWTGIAAEQARAHGAKVALMSAWPALFNSHTWLAAESSYRNAALAHGACVFPVATAWRLAHEESPSIRLYQADQLHPRPEGTLLAALVIVRGIQAGPYRPAPPQLGAAGFEPSWSTALGSTAALDAFANRADQGEEARCRLDK